MRVGSSNADEPALPRWPSTLRSGTPRPEARGVWPFDPELAGINLGLRRLMKRESFGEESARNDRAWLESRGLRVVEVDPPDREGRRVLFAAKKDDLLVQAVQTEHELRQTGTASVLARRWLGRELGYPGCCVDAYVSAPRHDDLGLARALLSPLPSARTPALTQWLVGALALISHVPCSLRCEPTIELAQALLDGLDGSSPGFAERWMGLARRLHVVDSEGRCLSLEVEGELTTKSAAIVRSAVELRVPTADDLSDLALDRPDLAGDRLKLERGLVVSERTAWQGVLAADHRE